MSRVSPRERAPRLWNRDFALYWLALAMSALGDAGVYIALPFLVLDAGGDASNLATVLILATAPRFFGPIVGGLADRVPLRIPIGAAALTRAILFVSLGSLALAGDLPVWTLYVAAPVNGLLTLFVVAAGNVALPRLVPRQELARANALAQGASMGLPLVGFGAAGAAVAAFGSAVVLCASSPLFAVMAAAAIRIRFPAVDEATAAAPWWDDVRRGAAFALARAPIAFLLLASFVLNASLNALNVLMPVRMNAHGHGAAGFGMFESLVSVGVLVGIGFVSLAGDRIRAHVHIGIAQLLFAVGFAIMTGDGASFAFAGGVVLGLGIGIGEVAILTLLQLAIPDGMRGKVLGVAFTANAAGLAFGAWAAGAATAHASPAAIFGFAGLAGACMLGGWLWLLVRDPDALDRLLRIPPPTTGG